MTFYVGTHPNPDAPRASVWTFYEKCATRVDAVQVAKVLSGSPPNVVVEDLPGWTFSPLKLAPGEFYPRMARPTTEALRDSPGVNPAIDKVLVETGRGQLVALREQMERVFRTVHPSGKNFEAYGHDIRNLLILAATEVEAHWKGILKAHGVNGFSTNDYVKLLPAMKLDSYAVRLPFYPWLTPITPFKGWVTSMPTQSLSWYDAYNSVKHDRETLFEQGTLYRAIEAVCACAVITFAQFGRSGFHDSRQLLTFFHLTEVPRWEASELYALISPEKFPLKSVCYPF